MFTLLLCVPFAHAADVYQGNLSLTTADVPATLRAARERVRAIGGRVDSDVLTTYDSSAGELVVEIPPAEFQTFFDWISAQGVVTDQRVELVATNTDSNAVLAARRELLQRLQEEMTHPDHSVQVALELEAQMSRVLEEIAALEGSSPSPLESCRLTLTLSTTAPVDVYQNTHFHPGIHAAMWSLRSPEGVEDLPSLGLTLHVRRAFTVEVDVLGALTDTRQGVAITLGVATWSDHLGSGQRAFLNPYLGFRLGYAAMGTEGSPASHLLTQADAGIELLRWRGCFLEAFVRPTVDVGEGALATGLVYGGGLAVPF